MSQQEHNKTISVKAFEELCDEVPYWAVGINKKTDIRPASYEEYAKAKNEDENISSFYYDRKLERIVAILWEE